MTKHSANAQPPEAGFGANVLVTRLSIRWLRRGALSALVASLAVCALGPVTAARGIAWSDPDLVSSAPGYLVSLHGNYETLSPANQYCSGVMLAPRWILTAAHCLVDDMVRPSDISVATVGGQRAEPMRFYPHPRYRPNAGHLEGYDIALIHLRAPLIGVAAAKLPPPNDKRFRQQARVYGFGLNEYDEDGEGLGGKNMTIDNKWGRSLYPMKPGRQLAAYGRYNIDVNGGRDMGEAYGVVCLGDSGGPLLASNGKREVVIGVVSYGIHCTDTGPNVYTRVSAHLAWLRARIAS